MSGQTKVAQRRKRRRAPIARPWPSPAERPAGGDLASPGARGTNLGAAVFRQPAMAMVALLLVAFLLRVLWLDKPSGVLIGDEGWYVAAARALLGLPQPPGAHYAAALLGRDPNTEHPPLGKLLLAASMALGGDNAFGWRWPSVLAGMLSVAFMARLARAAGLGAWAAVFAAFLLAFDTLAFVLGRVGMLDSLMLLGLVAGAAWFLQGRPVLAGLAFAFGALCKEPGALGPLAMAVAAGLAAVLSPKGAAPRWADGRAVLRMLGAFIVGGLLVWWVLDLRWTAFPTPFAQLASILADERAAARLLHTAPGASAPWQWLVDQVPYPFYTAGLRDPAGALVALRISFQGVLNPFLALLAPVTLGYAGVLAWREGDRPALVALVWAAALYLPFVAVALAGRFTFLYYALPLVPALALATARAAAAPGLPRPLIGIYTAAYLYAFAFAFPFVGFRCC